ncbi:hypothetical protein VNO80_33425 [Phaseolus coccineus]|uniref:Senescence-associated protein n=1 Tax=Phaseolus coccineus TaxID=3886 RepID=A0AAN9KZC7_PHACN
MIGRADIEGSKSNVAMNAWLPQASYPCGNFSDTSSFKFRRTKGSIGHAFTVRIRTGNQNQTSFYPFVPHEISVLVELILDTCSPSSTGSSFPADSAKPVPWLWFRWIVDRDSGISGPKGPVPNPSPDRHATTRSRRGSSSSSPPTADGFGTGTPVPSPQSQSFSRGYGSILPTSLAYIVPSTRGCSPWRPDAVMSTTGRGEALGPPDFSRAAGGAPDTTRRAICTDDRSARAHALGFTATAAPSYSSGLGPCPDGRVSAQLGTVTQLPVHPASPVLLTKNGPLGALDSVARLNRAAVPSYLFKSDERFARQYRCGPPPEFPLASPRSGIVHHLSGPDRLLGPCFKTGRMGSPQADARSAHVPRHAMRRALPSTIATMTSPRAFQQPGLGPPLQSASVNVPSRSADRLTPFHIRPGHIAGPHPLPSRQFQALFDSLFKVLFIFPSRYLFAIGLSLYLALDGIYRPIGAAFPNNPTRRQRLVVRQGPGTTGLSPSLAPPSRGLGPGPPLRTLLQTTIRTPKATDSHGGLFPVRSPLLGESFHDWSRAWAHPPISRETPSRTCFSTNHEKVSREACPQPNGFGRNLRSKTRWSRDSAIHTKYRISLRSSSMQEPRYPAGVSVLSGDTGLRPDAPSRPPALSTTHTGGRAPAVVRCSVDFSPRRGQRTAHVAAIRTLHRTIQSVGATGDKSLHQLERPCTTTHRIKKELSVFNPYYVWTCTGGTTRQLRPGAHRRQKGRPDRCTPEADPIDPTQRSNYELFNCNNLNIRYWSWNYRGCWHQTCLQWILVKGFRLYSFQLPDSMSRINQVASIRVAPAPARVGRLCSSLPHTRPSHIADRESSRTGRTTCVTLGSSETCTAWWRPQTETLFANKHGCLLVPTVSSAFLLPNTAREDGFDGEATGMSRCLPSGAHVCPQSETHTQHESHIFLPECIRDWVLGWCCVCMAQIFPRSHQARVSTRLTRVVFQLPKIIQADHDAKMVEGEPTQ